MPERSPDPKASENEPSPATGASSPATSQERRGPVRITNRHCVIVGIVAAIADAVLLSRSGAPAGSMVLGAAFVGVFVGGGMKLIQHRRDKREALERATRIPELRDVQRPTPGGWANPTRGQRVRKRIDTILTALPTRRAGRRDRQRRR